MECGLCRCAVYPNRDHDVSIIVFRLNVYNKSSAQFDFVVNYTSSYMYVNILATFGTAAVTYSEFDQEQAGMSDALYYLTRQLSICTLL